MIIQAVEESEARFEAYVQALASVIGHQDRTGPLKGYCKGLLVDTDRKSVEPMAAATAPERTAPQHQSLLHFVGNGTMVRRFCFAKSPRLDFAGPGKAWLHRGLDP
jgi:SRSO17 transposase